MKIATWIFWTTVFSPRLNRPSSNTSGKATGTVPKMSRMALLMAVWMPTVLNSAEMGAPLCFRIGSKASLSISAPKKPVMMILTSRPMKKPVGVTRPIRLVMVNSEMYAPSI